MNEDQLRSGIEEVRTMMKRRMEVEEGLKKRIQQLRKALHFYAQGKHFTSTATTYGKTKISCVDLGIVALKALEEDERNGT